MRCAECGWPVSEAAVISMHHTSEGLVRYLRCPCGQVLVQLIPIPAAVSRL